MIGKKRYKKTGLIIALLVTWLFNSVPALAKEVYVYSNIEYQDLTITLTGERDVIGYGHVEVGAEKCKIGNLDFCFESEGFMFALTKEGDKIDYNGWKIENSSRAEYYILGELFELNRIELKRDTTTLKYWYSKDSGVLFINFKLNEVSSFFVLKGSCGYGSIKNCEDVKQK